MQVTGQNRSLSGWDLGIVPPNKRVRTVILPGKAKCAICGRIITDREWRLYQACDFWKCKIQHRKQQRILRKQVDRQERSQREEFDRRVRLLRHKAAGLLGIDGPERFLPALVPAIRRPITHLPQARKSALGNHMRRLIAEADEKRTVAFRGHLDDASSVGVLDEESRPLSIVQEACAMCQGDCCITGGNHAYITVETILHYSNEHPDLDANEIRASLLSYVEERTFGNSCIYHGANGCGLPRNARSTVCNKFECAELRGLLNKLSGTGPHRVFLFAAEKNRVVRYAFVHA